MSVVSVVKVRSDLEDEVRKLIQLASGEDTIAPGDTVLLKPNIHTVQLYTTGGTTNPHVVAAVPPVVYNCTVWMLGFSRDRMLPAGKLFHQ